MSLPRRPALYYPNATTQPCGGVMDGTEAVAIVGVVVAVIGYFVTYRTNLRLAQRKDRLERINRQLSEFYGPLLALTRSSDQSWQAFRKRYRPGGGSFWKSDPPLTVEDAAAWRLRMTTVFVPVHHQMMELVLNRAHLIEEPATPSSLLTLCAPVNRYQAILTNWDTAEISIEREDNLSIVNFPG